MTKKKEEKNKTVWETLSAVDVNDHTEEKNGFTYLSWAWAWQTLKDIYPEATYEKALFQVEGRTLPYMVDEHGYAYVEVTVTIIDTEPLASATEVFPVLDYANKSIMNPNSFQVNTALQRCLAKTISMLGLGAYIYAGEDLPPTPKDAEVTIISPTTEEQDGVQKKASGADLIFATFSEFMKMQKTVGDLEKFYGTNIDAARILQKLDATKYEKMISEFKARKKEIVDEQGEKEKA